MLVELLCGTPGWPSWSFARPSFSPQHLRRGDKLALRADVLMVADPGRLAVALDVPESMLGGLSDGTAVVVRPVSSPDLELAGSLEIGAGVACDAPRLFPRPRRDENPILAVQVFDHEDP